MPTIPTSLWVYRARVVRIVDGDTLDVYVDRGECLYSLSRLRLLSVNTPEVKGPTRAAGLAATAYVKDWLAEAGTDDWPLIVRTEKADAFGRFLALVWRVSDGRQLNADLLAAGQAVPFDG